MNEEKLTFSTYGEFLEWKNQEEKLTNTSYVQRTSCHQRLGVRLYYFYCNRSGVYKTKGEGK